MWIYFWGENLNFAVCILAAMAFFATAWLYFDTQKIHLTRWLIITYVSLGLIYLYKSFGYLHPLLSVPISVTFIFLTIWYHRQAYVNLEKHLTPLIRTFFLYTIAQIFALHVFVPVNSNPLLFSIFKIYGLFWHLHLVFLAVASLLLIRWVFNYLLKRLATQNFLFSSILLAIVFVVTTASFSFFFYRHTSQTYNSLVQSQAQLFSSFLDAKNSQLLSQAETLAQSPQSVALALDHKLGSPVSSTVAGYLIQNNNLVYQVTLPVYADQKSQGSVTLNYDLDSLFLNSQSTNTNINMLAISQERIIASSFMADLLIGNKLTDKNSSSIRLLNHEYFAGYIPLKDSDNVPISTLIAVQPASEIITQATQTLHYMFFVTIIIFLVTLFPTLLVSRYLQKQYT